MNTLNTGTSQIGLVIMKLLLRIVAAAVLLCLTGFCVFGFLASFEVGWISLWHFLYGACGIGSLAIAMRLLLWRVKEGKPQLTVGLSIAAAGLFLLAVLLLWLWAQLMR
jgi:hypothetical protein